MVKVDDGRIGVVEVNVHTASKEAAQQLLEEFMDAGSLMAAVALRCHREGWALEVKRRRDEPLILEDVLAHNYVDMQMMALQFERCMRDIQGLNFDVSGMKWWDASLLRYVMQDFHAIMRLSTITRGPGNEVQLGEMVEDREYAATWVRKLGELLPSFRQVAEILADNLLPCGTAQPMSRAEELWALKLMSARC